MIRRLSLAAALAVVSMSSAAWAGEEPNDAEAAIEAAAERFEARMEHFGERAEAIEADASLSDAQRGAMIAALWSEYAPDVAAFSSEVSVHATALAADAMEDADVQAEIDEAMAGIDIDAIVEEAMAGANVAIAEMEASPEMAATFAGAATMAATQAEIHSDPDVAVTRDLVADYVVGQAMDGVEVDDED